MRHLPHHPRPMLGSEHHQQDTVTLGRQNKHTLLLLGTGASLADFDPQHSRMTLLHLVCRLPSLTQLNNQLPVMVQVVEGLRTSESFGPQLLVVRLCVVEGAIRLKTPIRSAPATDRTVPTSPERTRSRQLAETMCEFAQTASGFFAKRATEMARHQATSGVHQSCPALAAER